MRQAVVDASTALKWVLDEDHSEQAATLLRGVEMHAPDHWLSEATHAIANAVRRRDVTEAGAEANLAFLCGVPVKRASLADLAPRACGIALAAGITGYDAFYVALAERLGVPLVTADQKLLRRLAEARIAEGLTRFVGDLA